MLWEINWYEVLDVWILSAIGWIVAGKIIGIGSERPITIYQFLWLLVASPLVCIIFVTMMIIAGLDCLESQQIMNKEIKWFRRKW